MKTKLIISVLLLVSLSSTLYAQEDTVSGKTGLVIDLSKSHIPSNEPLIFFVDFMLLDTAQLYSLDFERNEVRNIQLDAKANTIAITTKLLFVLGGELYATKKEKRANLSRITSEKIASIEKIDRGKASELYGKKGKHGALLITTVKDTNNAFLGK